MSGGSSSHSTDTSVAGGSQYIAVHVTGDQEYHTLAREIEEVKFAVLGESSTPKEPNGSGVGELRSQIKRSAKKCLTELVSHENCPLTMFMHYELCSL